MEEILSSIKRIIAEDADGPAGQDGSRRERAGRDRESHRKAVVANLVKEADEVTGSSYVDEVLELTDEMPRVGRSGKSDEQVSARTGAAAVDGADDEELELTDSMADEDGFEEIQEAAAPASAPETIVSVESEVAARSSLAALSSMIVKAQEPGDNTLEGLVREMLRPMLKEWLDANLPTLVEGMVAKEIARITGRSL